MINFISDKFLCQKSRFFKKDIISVFVGYGIIKSCLFFWYKVSWFFCPEANQVWPELLSLGIQVHSICMYGRNCNTIGKSCLGYCALQFFFKMYKILFTYTRESIMRYIKRKKWIRKIRMYKNNLSHARSNIYK